jgi:hypothetical protein
MMLIFRSFNKVLGKRNKERWFPFSVVVEQFFVV